MKKTLGISLLLFFMSMMGITASANMTEEYKEQYPEYVSAMNEAFENGYYYWYDGYTLKDVPYGWDNGQFASEMINSVWWDIKPSNAEVQEVLNMYDLPQHYCVYDKDLLEQVIDYKFNLSVDKIAEKAQKESSEWIIETDDYWLAISYGRGEAWPGSHLIIDSFEKINNDVAYVKWHYENQHDSFTEYSDTYYAILEKGSIAGRQIVGYRYLGTVQPSDYLITLYKYNMFDIYEEYIDIISQYDYYDETSVSSIYYFIYDIDKDGTPELIINDQALPSASDIYVYTYENNKATYVGEHWGGRVRFYTHPENGLAVSYTMDGVGTMELISIINGQLRITQEWDVWGWNELALLPYGSKELDGDGWYADTFEIDYDYMGKEIVSLYKEKDAFNDKIKVLLNGTEIEFDQPPIIKNERTLVPMRAIFEAMGCEVFWDDGMIDVWKDGKNIMTLWIGNTQMWLPDGNITLDVPPQIVNDRTLVPVRAISESMGASVYWDSDTRTVDIYMHNRYASSASEIETE